MNVTLDEPVTSSEAEIATVPADIDQPCHPGRGNHHRHHHYRHQNKTVNEEKM